MRLMTKQKKKINYIVVNGEIKRFCAFCGAEVPQNRKYCDNHCERQYYRYHEVIGIPNISVDIYEDEQGRCRVGILKTCELCGEEFQSSSLRRKFCPKCSSKIEAGKKE